MGKLTYMDYLNSFTKSGSSFSAVIDNTLSIEGAAADAKKVGDLIDAITPGSWSDEAKDALLACFEHVAWTGDDGKDYYDALHLALYPDEPIPERDVIAQFTSDAIAYGLGYAARNDYSVSHPDSPYATKVCYENAKRASYLDFNIVVEPGTSCKIEWDDTTFPDSRGACQIVTEAGIAKLPLPTGSSYANDDMDDQIVDTGWFTNGSVLEIPATFNSSAFSTIRLTFKANDADSANMTEGSIAWVKITKDRATEEADKIRVYTRDVLSYHVGVLNDPPYYTTYEVANRICHWQPIEVKPSVTYGFKFSTSSSYTSAQVAPNIVNENVISAMDRGVAFSGTDTQDPVGYISNNGTVTVPALINNALPKGMRMSFRPKSSGSGNFNSNDAIKYVVVTRRW